MRFYDATDPAKIVPLSEWSCDQGDPKRPIQTGSGTHRSYYDGGRYAYLDTAPDNSFTRMESSVRHYSNGIQIIDVADPSQPKFVANWWLPGQREGEEEAYKQWREYGDRKSFTTLHGPMYVPRKVEDGGRYGYSAYSALGMMVHDFSDIANPKLVGRFYPKVELGAIPFHTIDVARLDRGFVITNPEVLNPDCNEPYQPSWIIDVRDPTKPQPISQLPVPLPPQDAPYRDFCDKRGRFGPHNPPHLKAPGKPQSELHRLHVLQCRRAVLRHQGSGEAAQHRLLHPAAGRRPRRLSQLSARHRQRLHRMGSQPDVGRHRHRNLSRDVAGARRAACSIACR